jgi:hypothetical protein
LDAFSQPKNGGQFPRPFFFASKDGDDEKAPFFLETPLTEENELLEEATKPFVSDEVKEGATKVASAVSNVLMEEVMVSRKEFALFNE